MMGMLTRNRAQGVLYPTPFPSILRSLLTTVAVVALQIRPKARQLAPCRPGHHFGAGEPPFLPTSAPWQPLLPFLSPTLCGSAQVIQPLLQRKGEGQPQETEAAVSAALKSVARGC